MELVRFTDIATKEVVNLTNGRCLGNFADCDIRIDPETGKILEIILGGRAGLSSLFFSPAPTHVIPWDSIVRIGVDTIIISIDGQKS
jgi:YlmC/YmxH family sporulation protein